MGLFSSLVSAAKNAIYGTPVKEKTEEDLPEKPQLSYVASAVNYAYNTVEHLFSQVAVLPKTVRDLWEYEPSAPIVNTILLTLYRDVIPIITFKGIYDASMGYADEKRDKDAPWVSLDTALCLSLGVIHLGANLYIWHKAGKGYINNSTANLFVASAFSGIKGKPQSTLCDSKCNTGLVVLNNYINETATLYANEGAVFAIDKAAPYLTPYVGWKVVSALSIFSTTFSIFSNGRYIARLTTPERCSKHKYLQSEYTLALGLAHKGLELFVFALPVWLPRVLSLTNGILIYHLPGMESWTSSMQSLAMNALNTKFGGYITNMSMPFLCLVLIKQSLFLFEVAIAAHLTPPLVKPEDRTFFLDPVEAYEKFANYVMNGGYEGIKSQIQRMMNGPPSTIDWSKYYNQGIEILYHPNTHKVQCFLLPPMVHSWENFINTPIISPYWDATHTKIIKIIETFEKYSRSNVVQVASISPGKAARLFQLLLGVPKPVAKAVLETMSDERRMELINAVRVWLENHSVKKVTNLTIESPEVPLNNNTVNPFEKNNSITPIEKVTHVNPEVALQLTDRRKPGRHDFFKQDYDEKQSKKSSGISPTFQFREFSMGNT